MYLRSKMKSERNTEKGYRPDIMHLVSVADLGNVGMAPGDAIRMREYASRWWTDERRCATKRPQDTEVSTQALLPVSKSKPPSKKLRFEKCYNGGGGLMTFRPAVKSGTLDDDIDYAWWVYSKELGMFVPLPMGKVPVLLDE